jgi:hypothetical protein
MYKQLPTADNKILPISKAFFSEIFKGAEHSFILPLPFDKSYTMIKKFTAHLGADSNFVQCTFANVCMM